MQGAPVPHTGKLEPLYVRAVGPNYTQHQGRFIN